MGFSRKFNAPIFVASTPVSIVAWRDIMMTNQPNISAALGQLVAELQTLKESLDLRDFNRLRDLFTAANQSLEDQRARRYQSFEKL